MGPTGEKGEKGSVGEKGVDLSKEVGNLEHKLLKEERKSSKLKKFVKSMNATISVQAAEIKSLLQSSGILLLNFAYTFYLSSLYY